MSLGKGTNTPSIKRRWGCGGLNPYFRGILGVKNPQKGGLGNAVCGIATLKQVTDLVASHAVAVSLCCFFLSFVCFCSLLLLLPLVTEEPIAMVQKLKI